MALLAHVEENGSALKEQDSRMYLMKIMRTGQEQAHWLSSLNVSHAIVSCIPIPDRYM